MIPYYLYKNYDFDCSIATYENSEEYSYINSEVKGLKLEFVKKTKLGKIIDGLRYLRRNAKNIDILNIYHLNLSSYFYELAYKHYNRNGKIYLKLDMNPVGLKNLFKKDLRGAVKRKTIERCDIASVETTKMQKRLMKFYGDKVIYIPNGCYVMEDDALPENKENIILTVGNLGTYEKSTDVLMLAYAEYMKHSPDSSYRLRLVGTVEESFRPFIDEYFEKNPLLKEKVEFTGPITDKVLLNEEYKRARIFAFPSLSESFGIVLVEAALQGCYLITSDMVPAGYDVSNRFDNGRSVKAGDVFDLSRCLINVCDKEHDWSNMSARTRAFVENNFNWDKIIKSLYRAL